MNTIYDDMIIDGYQIEFMVEFNYLPAEPDVGLEERLEIADLEVRGWFDDNCNEFEGLNEENDYITADMIEEKLNPADYLETYKDLMHGRVEQQMVDAIY